MSASSVHHANPTGGIVDKDNHLRDSHKYIVLSLPEPARESGFSRMQQGLKSRVNLTSWMALQGDTIGSHLYGKKNDDPPFIPLGNRGRILQRRKQLLQQRRRW